MSQVCQAKYSEVPVWVLSVNGVNVMRRQKDGWVNATHLLKVANFDKPRRTKILERDVQTGEHEKVQGGYGKYQGTWVPLERARKLAIDLGVIDGVKALLDYAPKPGEDAPPPPPVPATRRQTSHAKPPAPKRARKTASAPAARPRGRPPKQEESSSPSSAAFTDEERQLESPSRKQTSSNYMNQYSAALLDLFMSPNHGKIPDLLLHPQPGYHINQPIDDEGHTVFHWACAMGQDQVVEALAKAGARVDVLNNAGQTPLMRAVQFTNNFDTRKFAQVLEFLKSTLFYVDDQGQTILHCISQTTSARSRGSSARYYLETVLNKMAQMRSSDLASFISLQNVNGDTALHIAARNGSRKLVKVFLSYGAPTNIQNGQGRTAQEYIYEYETQRRGLNSSSSPSHDYLRLQPPSTPLARHQPQQHISEAAITATQQAPGIIADYLEELAQTFDLELKDRDTDIEQVRNLLFQVKQNTATMQNQIPELLAQLGPEDELQAKMEAAAQAISTKSNQLHKIVERSQARDLASLVQAQEARVQDKMHHQISYRDYDPKACQHLAVTLEELQNQRSLLVNEILDLYATASSGDKINKYRRLVAMSCGANVNDIDDLLDGIAQALEDKD